MKQNGCLQDVNERVFGNNKKEKEGQEVTHTFYVDVSDIVLKEPDRGLKVGQRMVIVLTDSDKVYRAKKIVRKIKNAVDKEL